MDSTNGASSKWMSRVLVGILWAFRKFNHDSDNYSSKFMGSGWVWKIYFLSSWGSPRIFKGSHQMPLISILSEDKNLNFSRRASPVWACYMIRLFCTSLLKSDQATKMSMELCFVHRLFPCSTSCDVLTKVLMHCDIRSKCVQLQYCASHWCAGCKFGV